ncbi:hypothetical protein E1B28_011773 [Marasmius oreades]|uniref:Uncharacterized protein n=1 Tax=Marasmius oreades TaxID=181124 RepID=A0A9P7RUZ3_9AGAR|nr:uncharacterized protein E1B28_011773 [Marasmius oreades]KAG7090165.1 hypothetical protein E1B28_011773 [Marasmius oreades]
MTESKACSFHPAFYVLPFSLGRHTRSGGTMTFNLFNYPTTIISSSVEVMKIMYCVCRWVVSPTSRRHTRSIQPFQHHYPINIPQKDTEKNRREKDVSDRLS